MSANTASQPSSAATSVRRPMRSRSSSQASSAVNAGCRYCSTVAGASGSWARAANTHSSAPVPITPRSTSRPRRSPQGLRPAWRSITTLSSRLTTERASTTSPTGMRPPTAFTHTPIRLKLSALDSIHRAALPS